MTPTRLAQLADLVLEDDESREYCKNEHFLSLEAEAERERVKADDWAEDQASLIIKIEEQVDLPPDVDIEKLTEDLDF